MTDLNDILGSLDDDGENENGEVGTEEGDGMEWLNEEEEEAPIAPKKKKTSKKKASKKKVSRKVAPAPEPEEEEAPPPRKKKVAKKAAAKPAPAPEPEETPAPKRRGPKPGVKRGPRKARVDNDVLAGLRDELNDIATGDAEKSQLAQLKADIRTAKQLETQLTRFAAKVEKAVEAQSATVEKLEAQLAKLTGE